MYLRKRNDTVGRRKWGSSGSPQALHSITTQDHQMFAVVIVFVIVIVIVGSSQALHSIRTGCSPNVHCHTPIPILIVVAGVLEKTS